MCVQSGKCLMEMQHWIKLNIIMCLCLCVLCGCVSLCDALFEQKEHNVHIRFEQII